MKLLCLVSIFCLVSVSASAQQSTAPSVPPTMSDPQAVALVQHALAALTGGVPVSDVTLTGTAQRIAGSDDESGTATLTATSAGDSKLSLNLPSGPRTEIRNHSALPLPDALPPGLPATVAQQTQSVGAWSGPDGVMHGMANHNVMTDPAWFFPALTLANIASSSNYVLSYGGQESLDGDAVIHISAWRQFPKLSSLPPQFATLPQHLSQMDLYLDSTSLLPVALRLNIHLDNNALVDFPAEIHFSNYQNTNGIVMPLHIEEFINGDLALDLQIRSTALNVGLSTSTFEVQ